MQGVVSSSLISSTTNFRYCAQRARLRKFSVAPKAKKAQKIVQKVMAGVAQLVRASVCGTECRQFESGRPPHKIQPHQNGGVKFYLEGRR